MRMQFRCQPASSSRHRRVTCCISYREARFSALNSLQLLGYSLCGRLARIPYLATHAASQRARDGDESQDQVQFGPIRRGKNRRKMQYFWLGASWAVSRAFFREGLDVDSPSFTTKSTTRLERNFSPVSAAVYRFQYDLFSPRIINRQAINGSVFNLKKPGVSALLTVPTTSWPALPSVRRRPMCDLVSEVQLLSIGPQIRPIPSSDYTDRDGQAQISTQAYPSPTRRRFVLDLKLTARERHQNCG
ncbi:hypothetical protein C8R45DRAFT_944121 [Mycena sanguinolenta]|nr:hypothetical protein C8R45DRAFT_944121 [Mycena sanguinolenta]